MSEIEKRKMKGYVCVCVCVCWQWDMEGAEEEEKKNLTMRKRRINSTVGLRPTSQTHRDVMGRLILEKLEDFLGHT